MSVTTIGFKEFIDKLNNLPEEIKEEASGYVFDAAHQWEDLAKRDAPVNFGRLRQSITSRMTGELSAEITDPIEYAPYVEWGTGTRVSVPSGLQAYALTFKKNKLTIGRYPHPFFFIQKPLVEAHLLNNLKNLVNTEH
jgi:HK97 gp10 family phage protein